MCIGHKSKIFGRDSQCRCDLPTVSVFGNLEKEGETRVRLQHKHETAMRIFTRLLQSL